MNKVVRQGKLFNVKHTLHYNGSGGSVKYGIFGTIGMQIEVKRTQQTQYSDRYSIYISFFKDLYVEDDILTYKIKLSCSVLSVKDQCFTCDNNRHLIGEKETTNANYILDFLGTIKVVENGNSFAALYSDEKLTDFSLRGEDGAVRVHRAVLAASSPVFHRMLCGEWKEKSDGYVKITGTSQETLQNFKDYLYLRSLPEEGVEQLLLLASYYMMPALETRCADELLFNLKAKNTYNILELAIENKLTQLLLRVLEAVQDSYVKVNDIKTHLKPSHSGSAESAEDTLPEQAP